MGWYTLSIRKIFGLEPRNPPAPRELARKLVDRGIAAEKAGATEEAERHYRDAIGADSQFIQAHLCLGIVLQGLGRPAAAIDAHSRAIALDPACAAAHYNLGLACLQTGALTQAEAGFRASLCLQAEFPEAWVGLADALEALGRESDALAALDTAIGQRRHYAGALFNASILLRKMGRVEEAEARLDEIDLMSLFSAGRHTEAEAMARQMILAWPDYGFGWKVLGAVLAVERRFEEAAPALRRALAILPSDAEAHHNLAIVVHALAQFPEAEASYRRALELKPDYYEAHNNLANLLQTLGRFTEAESHCRRALELNPDYFEAHSDLGNLLETIGRPTDALVSYRRALALKPDYHLAHSNLGASLFALGRLTEAEASFRHALELRRDFRGAHDNLLFLLNYHPDKSPREVFAAYQDFDACFGGPLRSEWRAHTNDRQPERRLRVGYVSPDFRTHATRHFVEPLLDHHDRSVLEVFAYAEVAIEDEVTKRMKSRADQWIPTHGMDDAQLAKRIRADRIDILVDLAGHTRGNRLLVFARKPAPVAVTTIGFGYTTGLSAIDWFLTDGIAVPEGAEGVFSERPWRIPLCQVYRPAEEMGPVSALPALERGYVTFGTLTRAARINNRVVRSWSNILQRVPGSRLRIDSLNFRDAGLCEALAGQFAAHGINRDRLEMGFHSPPWEVMRGIDICLDCYPQNSGTTLFESLYMGIPFITLADRPSLGRLGASIAKHAGHAEWVAATETEYTDKAVILATDLRHLCGVRANLREEMRASPLLNERAYVRQVEVAYREMWRQWCVS
jgi:predicted O-linked N-acetylglucosamine transferase (SPINDLY family)